TGPAQNKYPNGCQEPAGFSRPVEAGHVLPKFAIVCYTAPVTNTRFAHDRVLAPTAVRLRVHGGALMSDLAAWSRAIGQTVRRLRTSQGLTQAELAGAEFSKSYISQLERGTVVPSLRALDVLAGRLGVPTTFFLDAAFQEASFLLKAASTAYSCGDLEALLSHSAHHPAGVTIPLNYWWGKAWLAGGNRRQAVRRWELGFQCLRDRLAPPPAEGFTLMAELAELYRHLGDRQASEHVRLRARETVQRLCDVRALAEGFLAL